MPGQDVDVATWLCDLGLERYTRAFLDAEVTPEVLLELTDGDLRELGLPLGPRKIVLRTIRHLAGRSGKNPTPANAAAQDARPGSSPSPPAERRLITVMFIDLVGSTALSARLDPEDLRELIGRYHRRVTAAVERLGGFVAKYMGDGVLAYFGYPRAHEDDAERAIRAGLELTVLSEVSRRRPATATGDPGRHRDRAGHRWRPAQGAARAGTGDRRRDPEPGCKVTRAGGSRQRRHRR